MDALSQSIRTQFITIHEGVASKDGYTPIRKSWRVDIIAGDGTIRTQTFDKKAVAENYADLVAGALASMITVLGPSTLPIDAGHWSIASERRRQTIKGSEEGGGDDTSAS